MSQHKQVSLHWHFWPGWKCSEFFSGDMSMLLFCVCKQVSLVLLIGSCNNCDHSLWILLVCWLVCRLVL